MRYFLALNLVIDSKNYYKKEWQRLGKPSPWLVNMNIYLTYHVLAGKFVGLAPEQLIPQYKALRVTEVLHWGSFIALIFTFLW